MTAVTHPRSGSIDLSLLSRGRSYLWLTLLAIAIAVLSLVDPSSPSYDPFSWLIWGREILHGQLTIAGGSSWKPLPVIFTTVFALFGSAQPTLWLIVARAGAALTVLMAVKLTVRITWGLVSTSRAGDSLREQGRRGRAVLIAPVALAGAAALICTTFTLSFPGNMLLGYSEGVMAAAFLIAAERAWDGHHRQAFAIGIIPCLDRPEVWPVWGLYGLWLMWRDPGARRLVIGLGILMLALWLVPQKLGGGSIANLASHAQHNHSHRSAVNTTFPFWNELAHTLQPLVLVRLEVASLLLIAYTASLLVRARRRLGTWSGAVHPYPAAVAAALCGAFGYLWWIGIALETQAGFAGNPRYAIIGVMLICVSGCAAWGWACMGLAGFAARALQRLRRNPGSESGAQTGQTAWLAAIVTPVLFALFVFVPHNFTRGMPTWSSIRSTVAYQAHLRYEFATLVQRGGGPQNVMGCGSVMANNLQVPMVAWTLGHPIPWIQALPTKLETNVIGPNVIVQDGATSTFPADQKPTNRQIQLWEQAWKRKNGTQYKIFRAPAVTLYMNCSTYSTT